MNTTTAATEAQVTVATIRTWCRRGVIAATKQAGRWVIDAASLTTRIAIGAMKRPTRQEATPVIDLNATYTAILIPNEGPTTITPTVKHRTVRRTGANTINITGLAPLFADRFDAIPDNGDRAHALTVFASALIVISDQYDADWEGDPQAREGGQLRTTYRGDVPGISIDDVLDLAAQLRTQLV
ncbi:MAG TPA: helix-turn-helix domain-containing protein [Streptomyces sp.]|nr:helix-turn-helix domain-containing protein [Streptomyces sp.]